MVKFELYMSEEDTEKIFALKEEAGERYDDYTANDYAELLLHKIVNQQFPGKVPHDENGDRVARPGKRARRS